MPHIDNEGYVPPLERAHRLMNEGGTEHTWANATGFVDIVLKELDKAEMEGEEWGKPVKDPQAYVPSVPIIYKDKQDFINQRIQPYLDRHQHLKGYIRSYAQDRVKQREETITESLQNPLAKNGEIGKSRPSDSCYNVTPNRGNNQEYLARRLARDCPEILDQIGKGKEFKSVRQAAIHAGIVKSKITVQFDPDETGGQIVSKLYQKLSDDQLKEMLENLLNYFGG